MNIRTRKSSIAKCVGGAVGTNGKIATGIGLAALLGAPFTGGINLFAGGALLTGGGAAAALGTVTSGLIYATEYYLCESSLLKLTILLKLIERIAKDTKEILKILIYFVHNMITTIHLK